MKSTWMTLFAIVLLAGCGGESPEPEVDTSVSDSPKPAVDRSTSGGLSSAELAAEPTSGGYQELEWDDLIPLDWQPDKLMSDLDADTLSDDDPRAQELMEKLQALWREAPVVQELNARRVRLPGFVVPLDMDASSMGEFLLVPYFGACIHVPPPPRNQTVYVETAKGAEYQGELFDTVWVSGVLAVESSSSDMGDAGYRIDALEVAPYQEAEEMLR
jgi:hypothetical protein